MSENESHISVDLGGDEARAAYARANAEVGDVLKSVRLKNVLKGQSNVTKDVQTWVTATILEVNTMASEFTVDLELEMIYTDGNFKVPKGVDSTYDGFVALDAEDVQTYEILVPRINLENCNNYKTTFYNVEVNFTTKEIFVQWNWIAVYHEVMELQRFPYDRQLLRIYIEVSDVNPLAPEEYPLSMDEWPKEKAARVESRLTDFRKDIGYRVKWSETQDPAFEAVCTITVEVEREPAFYLVNYGLIIFLIVILNSASLVISSMDERMQYTASLFLTLVAFKFVMMQSIPPVGYITLLDTYVLIAFAFLTLGVFENALVSPKGISLFGIEDGRMLDILFQGVIASAWIGLHVLMLILSRFQGFRLNWKQVYLNNDQEILFSIHRKKSKKPQVKDKMKTFWEVDASLLK